jgi:hypothetical protein
VAPSMASRGRPGALLLCAAGGRAGVAALAAAGRRAPVEIGRFGADGDLLEVLLAAAPTGARRRWLERCGRLFGSRLMMSGALVAGGVPPVPLARLAAALGFAAVGDAFDDSVLDRLLGGVARVAPGRVDCCSRSTVASRSGMLEGSGGARMSLWRDPARPILLAEPTATRLLWNSTHHASGTALSSPIAGPSSPFPGKTCPDSATFELETRINQ